MKEKFVTSGVAQGLAIDPDVWNLLYDALLRLEMPVGARLISIADDIALVVTVRTEESLKRRIEWAVQEVAGWLENHGLEQAA